MQRLAYSCLLALGLAMVPPAFAEEAADPVVARVGGAEIHRSEVAEAYRALPEQFAQIPMDAIFGELVQQLVDRKVLALAASDAGLEKDPDFARRLAQVKDQVLEDVYVDKVIDPAVTDAMMKARYDKILADNPPEEEIKARHILVDSEDEAKALKAEVEKGADFAALANERSKDARDGSGGDLGWFTRERMVPEFAEAAFAATEGKVAGPVKSQFGWHLILVEGRRKQAPPPFEDVKPQLRQLMVQELTTERIEKLKSGMTVEILNPDGSTPRPTIAPSTVAPPPAE